MDLLTVFNHMVLPPQLPGAQDEDLEAISYGILRRFIQACKTVESLAEGSGAESFESLRISLEGCLALNTACLEKSTLLENFNQLQSSRMIVLHINAQNAALLIRCEERDGQQLVIFESFEASPTCSEVLSRCHALEWDFPGRSAQLSLSEFNDEIFQESLAAFLEKASMEPLYTLQAQTRKAGVSVIETRDTNDPALITQMLMPLLEAKGGPYHAPVLRKHVRDEVAIYEAELPWRRLPFWLVLRVAAQRQLCLAFGSEIGRMSYKLLMCSLFSALLKECSGDLSPELTMLLRTKICRRMKKLEDERTKSTIASAEIDELFSRICPLVKNTVIEVTAQVEAAWKSFKQATTRRIPRLPLRAPDSALQLSLANSSNYLERLLSNQPKQSTKSASLDLPQPLEKSIKQAQEFTNRIFRFAAMETRLENDTGRGLRSDSKDRCRSLAEQINEVFTEVGTTYYSDPEQMSAIALTVFTLWIRLDKCAISACPILENYRPPFSPELLDVLQLPTKSKMQRLQDIQLYLARRSSRSLYDTIFNEIGENSIAVRYAAQSTDIQSLDSRIQVAYDMARNKKEAEWERACREYDRHTTEISSSTCCCSWKDGKRDVRGCSKCWHRRVRNRMKIMVQEAFLPSNNHARAAAIFELAIPPYLSAYRDATWCILRTLAYPAPPRESATPRFKLNDYVPLQPFIAARAEGILLASSVKTFEQTHYKFQSGKVSLSRLLPPLAARLELYDSVSGLWIRSLDQPLTMQHLCGIHVPRMLQVEVMPPVQHPPPTIDGPSSYEIQAYQSKCPSNVSIHEFTALQKLLAGKLRRWPNMLVEMGSSNLNFSDEDTTRVLCQLAVQAGPQLADETLRSTHVIFREPVFIERLTTLIESRLHSIKENWREHHCMELLITLSLRLYDLTVGNPRDSAEALLQIARTTTANWTARLRKEVRTANDAEAGKRAAIYGVYAALLCRHTFAAYAEVNHTITAEDLSHWVQASVAWQEYMVVEMDKLPQSLERILVRDAKMSFHIAPLLKSAIVKHPAAVGDGITGNWSDSSDALKLTFSPWAFLESPHDRWVVSRTSQTQGRFISHQTVHFNITEGHLLVNGRPRGKLPLEIRENATIKTLFGEQHLLTYPSSLPGMTHRLVHFVYDQEVHFGMRDGDLVIMARTKDSLLEFVPKSVFGTSTSFDLPAELVDSCVHWLNLKTGCLEIRRMPKVWVKRPRDWEVDVLARQGYRGNVQLVDPRSDVFLQIARIFEHFVRPDKLTVFQPLSDTSKITVDLRHMELSFSVNRKGLLQSRQLKAEIDPDQDAGTWYGLESKIVLRDAVSLRRSIILPLGQIQYQRRGMHVAVRMENGQEYGTFMIDDILRRLSCPPEPRLLFTKALCHATTSFCLPDTLTGCTGTEEAFSILRSSMAQPWIPLGTATHEMLQMLQALSPRREYYPPEIKRLQKVTWDSHLTMTIQHDEYESLIRKIMLRSNRLKKFAGTKPGDFEIKELTHLNRRGAVRRRLYERQAQYSDDRVMGELKYVSRDRKKTSTARNVYETVRSVLTRRPSVRMTSTLKSTLEFYQVIEGFQAQGHSSLDQRPLINQIEDPINEVWGELVNFCIHAETQTPVIFCLALLAFAPETDRGILQSLVAFASVEELQSLQPPPYENFLDFKNRGKPSLELLRTLVTSARLAFRPTFRRGRLGSYDANGRDAQEYLELCEEEERQFANHISQQWPIPAEMLSIGELNLQTIDVTAAMRAIKLEWGRRWQNEQLDDYIDQVQEVLDSLSGPHDVSKLSEWKDGEPAFSRLEYHNIIPSLPNDLITKSIQPLDDTTSNYIFRAEAPKVPIATYNQFEMQPSSEFIELRDILKHFSSSPDALRHNYGEDLLKSLAALEGVDFSLHIDGEVPVPALEAITFAKEQAHRAVMRHSAHISTVLGADNTQFSWLQLGAIFPCTTPTALLELLRSKSPRNFGCGMKEALTNYGLAITNLQRVERIRQALLRGDRRAISEELQNEGHENWSTLQRPDWLLLEIDSNLLIRAEQVEVAEAIIAPASGRNSVLQMNMGKGKTSCIVPMAMAVLADGKSLSRLIVPKALLMQTAQMVQSRLGGLVGREVCHIPFSRKTPTDTDMLDLYADLHRETHAARGLILTSHEHVLSYKLGGWQHFLDGKSKTASAMVRFQDWLDSHCRDVLDECDFTLSVKTQLNYPSGSEMAIDGHPFRWKVAQELLGLAFGHIPRLQRQFKNSIDLLERPGSLPTIYFLKSDVEDALQDYLVEDICAGRLSLLRIAKSRSQALQRAIRRLLSEKKFDKAEFTKIVSSFPDPQAACKILLVARGLLLDKILLLCLGKRWNVQYGLHPGRHPVAVPFEAKGVPSEQSEFGQPDVAILFTCLAFYYSGLSLKQFRQGLQHILQSDDPATQYERWTFGCNSLPEALRHWNVVNVDDEGQVDGLWRHLRKNRIVLDHYMNHFVFPAHAKQFEVKLQASAWDIPLYAEAQQTPRTTGFSGTNDNRIMLPLTIRQDDLPSLTQTSAEVLSYLLQRRNRRYYTTVDSRGRRLTELGLVENLCYGRIRVLIDAGAYILEMDNRTLAKNWLTYDHEAKAAVYFGADNRAWVYFRGEIKGDMPLLATPFADDLSECVVYLDEAHTRGVDLKLPADAHGALTLSLKQTKDATMQAAMRLRQLRTTQSLSFFAPPEVHLSIMDFCRPPVHKSLDSSHVIRWLLEQTCRTNEDLQSLYITQGLDYCRRTNAVWKYRGSLGNVQLCKQLVETMPQPERQTLEQMYGEGAACSLLEASSQRNLAPQLQIFRNQLLQSRAKGHPTRPDALQEVEQHREVQNQLEQVRQVQKPVHYEALSFPGLHPAIMRFVSTGLLDSMLGNADPGFEHAFAFVARTKIGIQFGVRETDSRLFVSKEFGKTIRCKKKQETVADNFLRPVEWILWSPQTQTALVIIPEEVELLIPKLRLAVSQPPVHLIAYAAPVTKNMLPFNSLKYYSLPPLPPNHNFPSWLRLELGVLAGRLYVETLEVDMLIRYLHLTPELDASLPEENDEGDVVAANGSNLSHFANNPISFLLEWLVLRRKTQDVLHTPMGYICSGRSLDENSAFRGSLQ
ncbi:hypothetical protein F5Y19DRAFT_223552 [Xylariaceae sp. FL1651]|nr:hypothetical protein F5Y19DRAFT_223552 [Xylariaceae sp. FL1651]